MKDVNTKENYKETLKVSWYMFDINMKILAKEIKYSGVYIKYIYGVPRGGMVVAVRLSHLLGIDVVEDYETLTSHVLIADDISDVGTTLLRAKRDNPLCPTATFFYNETSKFKPDFYAWKQDKGEVFWVEFPWETK